MITELQFPTFPIDKRNKMLYNDTMELTGDKLRELRHKHNMTLVELAGQTGYTWTHIQRMEKGRYKISDRLLRLLIAWEWIK